CARGGYCGGGVCYGSLNVW
nr:immunoglobulin heavy chain junction region [Macaca mulatta]MOV42805.1 immunoglobulin heavy chain junction region [Macaca mulatta]MOV43472.1 immunoglobulin heavy chain junction region [Macaca mulatta]MOV44852.1 immunoglobulin heavy chain junction region [Macaca mulatta]MOV45369.1 immunoglobulin heavy chain junction region [Macaca mulatta]